MSVEEIEIAIAQLPDLELADLLAWVDAFRASDSADVLSPAEAAQVRAGIAQGLADCEAGRARPAGQWAAALRQEFGLPTHLSDSELTA